MSNCTNQRGFIINTKCLFSGIFTHTDDSNLNGASLPRNILLLLTPPTHRDDTSHTHMHHAPTHYPVILQNTQWKGGGTVLEIETLRAARTYCFKATALSEYRNCQFPNTHTQNTHDRRVRSDPLAEHKQKNQTWTLDFLFEGKTQLATDSKFKHPLNYMTAPVRALVTSADWLTTSCTFPRQSWRRQRSVTTGEGLYYYKKLKHFGFWNVKLPTCWHCSMKALTSWR